MRYHVYVSRLTQRYCIYTDAVARRLNKLARSRYKPVALGFRTRAEAERYLNRLAAAEEQPEPPRSMGKRK